MHLIVVAHEVRQLLEVGRGQIQRERLRTILHTTETQKNADMDRLVILIAMQDSTAFWLLPFSAITG